MRCSFPFARIREIVKETGASTATISRVKRALFDNDTYGYTLVLDRIKNGEKE